MSHGCDDLSLGVLDLGWRILFGQREAHQGPWPSMSFRISTPMTRLIAISSVLTRAKAIVGMGHFPPSRPG